MADVTFKRFEDLDGYNENFKYAAKGLGVTAWGMNILKMPAGYADYPEHDHVKDGQEEVYVVLAGSAKLVAGEASWDLEPGTLARVGPGQKRKLVPGPSGATILALGGTPGKAYEMPDWIKG